MTFIKVRTTQKIGEAKHVNINERQSRNRMIKMINKLQ